MRLPFCRELYDVCLGMCLAVSLVTPSIAAEGVRIPADDSRIAYVGHWGPIQRGGQTHMATINSSSQIYLNFTGTHVAGLFDLKDIEYLEQIDVKVDDGDWSLFTVDQPRIEFFPKGLPQGPHHLEIAVKAIDGNGDRWLPPLRSAIVFSGFELDSTAKAEFRSPAGQKPFIEFLGDSITQGEGILHTNGGAVINSDALATYAWLTAEALGTTHVQIAFGGSGVIRSGSGNVPPAPLSFAWNFGGSPADFSVVPDFILINLGTNDQYSSDEFVSAYIKLLREIRRHYARTVIFAMRPFHGDRYHGDDIANIVKTLHDPGIIYIDSTGWMDEGDFTDGAHPNVPGSRKAAAHLEEALRPYISRWKPMGTSN
jgi:lysophospholipase L1-like esterase